MHPSTSRWSPQIRLADALQAPSTVGGATATRGAAFPSRTVGHTAIAAPARASTFSPTRAASAAPAGAASAAPASEIRVPEQVDGLSVVANGDRIVIANDGSIVLVGDNGELRGNTGNAGSSGEIAVDVHDSQLSTGSSGLSRPNGTDPPRSPSLVLTRPKTPDNLGQTAHKVRLRATPRRRPAALAAVQALERSASRAGRPTRSTSPATTTSPRTTTRTCSSTATACSTGTPATPIRAD